MVRRRTVEIVGRIVDCLDGRRRCRFRQRSDPRACMTAQFTTTRRVEFKDTDMAGIVHFANFFIYMEQAEHEFFRSLGLDTMHANPDGSVIGWPRVSASCSYKAPAAYNEILDVRLNVVRKGVKSLTFKIDFWRGPTLVASGQLKTACCLIKHAHPIESIEIPKMYGDVIHEAAPE
jgi:YbgC/YbaW family acyl-CoA thioester hydrolase